MSYTIYGHIPVERDDNSGLSADDQQALPEVVVYTTENQQEAEQIVAAGGFINDGQWNVATRYDDASGASFSAASEFDGDESAPPQNSAAIQKPDGTVGTDTSVREMTQDDVVGIVEREAAIADPIRKGDAGGITGPRKILP